MTTFNDLRAGLTRWKQDPNNLVGELEYNAVIEFIQFLEAEDVIDNPDVRANTNLDES